MIGKIKDKVENVQLQADNIAIMPQVPQVVVKEHLDKFICAIDEYGNVAYYAKLPSSAKKNKIGGDMWMALFQESLKWISELDLSKNDLKVFLAMCSVVDFENYIRINQSELAKKLHTDQGNISRSIKKLLELNIITEGPRAGLNKTYMLNPNIGIKGKHRQQKIIDYEEAKFAREKEKKDKGNNSTSDNE